MKSSISHLHTKADPSHRAAPSGLALTFCLPYCSQGHLGAPQPSPISIVILSLMLIWQMRYSNPHQSLCMSSQSQPWGSPQVSHSVGEQLALGKGKSNRWDALRVNSLSNRFFSHWLFCRALADSLTHSLTHSLTQLIQTLLHNHKSTTFACYISHPCTQATATHTHTHTHLHNAFLPLVKHPKTACQTYISNHTNAVL